MTNPHTAPRSGDDQEVEALRVRVEQLEAALRDGIEAFRLTREYLGEDALPEVAGWSWFDWVVKARALSGLGDAG